MNRFDIVSGDQIAEGRHTDAYFERTEAALEYAGKNPDVVAEVTADQFPTGEFEVFAGIEDAAELLADLPIDVDALPEGQLFDGGPVMRIEGDYLDFARYETALLGFLSHASGMATAALDCTVTANEASGDAPSVASFGGRHVHPALGAMVERSALVGGVDGFSLVSAGEVLDREAMGTMPHALMLCFGPGNQEEAWTAFDEGVDEDVPRYVLADTFNDEVDEVLRVVEALGDRLDGVRLDTTGSRRGDFRHIIKEVRYKLAEHGREDVDIFVSGGLGPEDIRELRDVADGFGVGGSIVNADPVDFSLDIVEVDGEPISKRGKLSGDKDVYRTADGRHHVTPAHRTIDDAEGKGFEPLLKPLIRDGNIVREFDIDAAATRAREDADAVGFRQSD